MTRITPCARSGRPSGPANQRPVSSTQVLLCASEPSTRQYSTWYGTPVPKSRCAECITASNRVWMFSGSSSCAYMRPVRSEEHTSELQSLRHLVCRLLLEKQKDNYHPYH